MRQAKQAPAKALRDDALYFADNGAIICARCAGISALYTGHDISGQKVARLTVEDAQEWQRQIKRPVSCESGCLSLSMIAGADGWPLPYPEVPRA